ncbi:MAG: CocE/NonD family hydrolase [Actinobacteria bacterium]|nr:CocE/NonD family hydrolase [Actinomycetota bacterium]
MNARADAVDVTFDVPAVMRDGTVLRADVYAPSGDRRWPTILVRTPYGKDTTESLLMVDPVKAARSGFLTIVQDTRGRFSSDGDWVPFDEVDDGFDSVEWAATLPNSNGRVGMLGESYSGWTQWAAASVRPQALKAIVPAITWSDEDEGLYRRGGASELGLLAGWGLLTGFDHFSRLDLTEEEEISRSLALIDEIDNLEERGVWGLPDAEKGVLERHGVPGALGRHRASIVGRFPESDLPSLNIGGWYDNFVQATIDCFTEMSKHAPDTRLLIGPWSHIALMDPIGDVSFGLLSARRDVPHTEAGDLEEYSREFLRSHLDPDFEGLAPGRPVRYFTMGVNEWRDADTWPPPGAESRSWFLRADGELSEECPAGSEESLAFEYDPNDPVPTKGGAFGVSLSAKTGSVDQTEIESRDDVLVFSSGPLEEPLEITGRVKAVLQASSSAPSTDWIVRLCDVHPDGRSLNIVEGIVRDASATESRAHEIDLWSTSHVFQPGHRLRVHVTSSSFPRWDRNLNTGDQSSPEMAIARQSVLLGADEPSYIQLPVMGGKRGGGEDSGPAE